MTSSTLTFMALGTIGDLSVAHIPAEWRGVLLFSTMGSLVIADYRRLRKRDYCSVGPRRQTPRNLGWSRAGVVMWGLDTGIPFTTVRTTLLPVLAVLMTAYGFGARWIGLAYSAGFLSALWVLCMVEGP